MAAVISAAPVRKITVSTVAATVAGRWHRLLGVDIGNKLRIVDLECPST
jgi:hypothetical protein